MNNLGVVSQRTKTWTARRSGSKDAIAIDPGFAQPISTWPAWRYDREDHLAVERLLTRYIAMAPAEHGPRC